MEEIVKSLAKKANGDVHADEALKYSQAACNVANAMRVIADIKKHLT